EDIDVAIDGVQLLDVVHAGDAQRAVYGADMLEVNSVRNVNHVFDVDFHAFILRVMRDHGDPTGLGVDLDRDAVEIGLTVFRNLYGVHFDSVAVPSFDFDRAVHILQLKGAARNERIGLVE